MCEKSELQKVKVHIDTIDIFSKPSSKQIPLISQRLNSPSIELTAEELALKVVAPHSRTWIPAEFQGPRSNDNWKSQQVFALDFDGGIKLEEVLKRLEDFGLSCSFCYSTFSSSDDKPKFRVVFIAEESTMNKAIRDEIMDALLMLFPEADKGCRDSARMFFGGREILFTDYMYRLNLTKLVLATTVFSVHRVSKNTRTKRLAELGKKVVSINNIIESPKNPNLKTILDFDYSNAAKEVKILNDFMSGVRIGHLQLFGIATNLAHVKGGLKYMKEVMDKSGGYTEHNYNIFHCVRYYNYLPQQLANFSPYEEDHIHRNILEAGKMPKGAVKRIRSFDTISLEEGEARLAATLKQVKESDDTKIHVICASTGIGKTRGILDWDNAVMAFPDHELKKEVGSRMKIEYESTPNIMDYLSEEDKVYYKHCNIIGAYRKASSVIYQNRGNVDTYILTSLERKYPDYIDALERSKSTKGTLLTTHAWIQNALLKHNELIFDEDPFTSLLLTIHTALVSDIKSLSLAVTDNADRNILINILTQAIKGTPNMIIELKDYAFNNYNEIENLAIQNRNITSNVLDFLNTRHFLIDEHDTNKLFFIKKWSLPVGKKTIILSATANEFVYKKLYGDRVKFYDLGNVELKGKLVQDTTYTFSKQNLVRPEVLKYATENIEERMVITFQNCQKYFKNAYRHIYFGNCQGKDNFKDKPLAIVGTPHVSPSTYILYSKYLGLSFKPEDYRMSMYKVHRNGVYFNFFTFENEDLRNLQFYFIERELRQAVGRARLIRNQDADVLLLSNYPLPEAEQEHEI